MKIQIVASTVAAYAITSISLFARVDAVQAQASLSTSSLSVTFSCKEIDKIPNTVARVNKDTPPASGVRATRSSLVRASSTSAAQVISVIQWKRPQYPESKETSLQRCVRVSNILQEYNSKKALDYITSGEMDGRQVVCAASSDISPCSLLIFTLDKEDEAEQLVRDLRQVLKDPTLLISPLKPEVANRWGTGYRPPRMGMPGRREGAGVR